MSYKRSPRQAYKLQRKKASKQVGLKRSKRKSVTQLLPKTPSTPPERELSLLGTRKAALSFNAEGISVNAKVRYETERVDPLIKTAYFAKGEEVQKRYIGPKKRLAWIGRDSGKEYDRHAVQQMQQTPDGSWKPIKITKTERIQVEPIPKDVMKEFHPYSFLEVWGEGDQDEEGLRKTAMWLIKHGAIGGIKEFSHGKEKVYIGFLYPVLSQDGSHFTIELMLSENKKRRRRWMPAEPTKKTKAEEAEIPKMW